MNISASRPRPTSKRSWRTKRRSSSQAAMTAPLNPTMPGCIDPSLLDDPNCPHAGPPEQARLAPQEPQSYPLRNRPRHTAEAAFELKANLEGRGGRMSELKSGAHAIETMQVEKRRYPPDPEFRRV